MMNYYCQGCGAKTVFESRPNFCSKCGRAFSSKASMPAANIPPKDDGAEGTNITVIPDIDFQYTIDHGQRSEGITVGAILESNKGKKTKKSSKKVAASPARRGKPKSREEILNQFRQEAGNTTKAIEIE